MTWTIKTTAEDFGSGFVEWERENDTVVLPYGTDPNEVEA